MNSFDRFKRNAASMILEMCPRNKKYERIIEEIKSLKAQIRDPRVITANQKNCIEYLINDFLDNPVKNVNIKDVQEVVSEIIDIIDYTSGNRDLQDFWIRLIAKLQNPGCRLYAHCNKVKSDKELPTDYLFIDAYVQYRGKACVVVDIHRYELSIREHRSQRVFTVSLNDNWLLIPDDYFMENYLKWVYSLSIGEEVDFFVDNDSYHDWYRGVIEDIQYSGNNIKSLTIRACIHDKRNGSEFHHTIHSFTPRNLGRVFSKITTPSPGLTPNRFVFERNALISNTNHGLRYSNGHTVRNEAGMNYPSIYIIVVNTIAIGNFWHLIATAIDDLDMIPTERLRDLLKTFCGVIHLFYQDARNILTQLLYVPLAAWIFQLPSNMHITKNSPVDEIIHLFIILYEWSGMPLTSDLSGPSEVTSFIIHQLLSSEIEDSIPIVLDILQRLRLASDLQDNSWKRNTHCIVMNSIDYESLIATIAEHNLFSITLTHHEKLIRDNAAVLLAFITNHCEGSTIFIDEYWNAMLYELECNQNHLLRILIIELPNFAAYVLVHLLYLTEKKKNISKELLLFYFFIINTLYQRKEFTEYLSNSCMSFLMTLNIEPILPSIKNEFNQCLQSCIQTIKDNHSIFGTCYEMIKKNHDQVIAYIVLQTIIPESSKEEMRSDFLTILLMIIQDISDSISINNCSASIIELKLQIAQAIILHFSITISDKVIEHLWQSMWNTQLQVLRTMLFSFFNSTLSLIDSQFYASLLESAVESPSFNSLYYEQWTLCCHLWKAVNDFNHYMNTQSSILDISPFVFDSKLHCIQFVIQSFKMKEPKIGETIESLLLLMVSFEEEKKFQSLSMIIELLETLKGQIQRNSTLPHFQSFMITVMINLSNAFHWKMPNMDSYNTYPCHFYDTSTKREMTFLFPANEHTTFKELSDHIRQLFDKNCYLQYEELLSQINCIDQHKISDFIQFHVDIYVHTVETIPESLQPGMSKPSEKNIVLTTGHSQCERISLLFMDCIRLSKGSYDNIFYYLYPIPSYLRIIDLLFLDMLPDDFDAVFSEYLNGFSYMVMLLHDRVLTLIRNHNMDILGICRLFNKYSIPKLLLSCLGKFRNQSVVNEIKLILQLLYELYRPAIFYSPIYTNDKLYMYSYHSDYIPSPSALTSIVSAECSHEEREFLLDFIVRSEVAMENSIAMEPISIAWIWETSITGFDSLSDFYLSIIEILTKGFSTSSRLFISLYYAVRLLFLSYMHMNTDPDTVANQFYTLLKQLLVSSGKEDETIKRILQLISCSCNFIFREMNFSLFYSLIEGLILFVLDHQSSFSVEESGSCWNQLLYDITQNEFNEDFTLNLLTSFISHYETLPESNKRPFLLLLAMILRKQYIRDIPNLEMDKLNLLKEIMNTCIQEVFNADNQYDSVLLPFIRKWSSFCMDLFEKTIPVLKEVYNLLNSKNAGLSIDLFNFDQQQENVVPCGIKNPGSLCYMASILQQLYHSKFYERIRSAEWLNEMGEFSVDYCILENLKDGFRELNQTNGSSWDLTNWAKGYRTSNNMTVNIYQQEDAHEFLMDMFTRFEIIMNNTDDKDLIKDLFLSSVKTSTECSICHSVSSHMEVCYSYPLNVQQFSNMKESMTAYLNSEVVHDYRCSTCSRTTRAVRRTTLMKSPNNLIIHLKRFQYSVEHQKVDSFFSFPLVFQFDEHSPQYSLHGVVIHQGTCEGGHYYSIIQVKPGQWYMFNDAQVTPISFEEMQKHAYGKSDTNESAYLLFYTLQSKEESPVMDYPKVHSLIRSIPFWKCMDDLIFSCNIHIKNCTSLQSIHPTVTLMYSIFAKFFWEYYPSVYQTSYSNAEQRQYYQTLQNILTRIRNVWVMESNPIANWILLHTFFSSSLFIKAFEQPLPYVMQNSLCTFIDDCFKGITESIENGFYEMLPYLCQWLKLLFRSKDSIFCTPMLVLLLLRLAKNELLFYLLISSEINKSVLEYLIIIVQRQPIVPELYKTFFMNALCELLNEFIFSFQSPDDLALAIRRDQENEYITLIHCRDHSTLSQFLQTQTTVQRILTMDLYDQLDHFIFAAFNNEKIDEKAADYFHWFRLATFYKLASCEDDSMLISSIFLFSLFTLPIKDVTNMIMFYSHPTRLFKFIKHLKDYMMDERRVNFTTLQFLFEMMVKTVREYPEIYTPFFRQTGNIFSIIRKLDYYPEMVEYSLSFPYRFRDIKCIMSPCTMELKSILMELHCYNNDGIIDIL